MGREEYGLMVLTMKENERIIKLMVKESFIILMVIPMMVITCYNLFKQR